MFLFEPLFAIPLVLIVSVSIFLWINVRKRGLFDVPLVGSSSIIFVTGCDSGFGRCASIRFAQQGFFVVAGVLTSEGAQSLAEEYKKSIDGKRDNLLVIMHDVTKEEDSDRAVEEINKLVSSGKKLAGIINNAGIIIPGPIEFIGREHFTKQLMVNTVGCHLIISKFMPLIRAHQSRIVNVVSVAGRIAAPLMSGYCASKFAMEGYSDSLRLEASKFRVSVSVIEPGFCKTNIVGQFVHCDNDYGWSHLSDKAKQIYSKEYELTKKNMDKLYRFATDPQRVVDAMEHALTSPRPQTRYLIGIDAKMLAFLALFPDRLRDYLVGLVK